MKLNKEESFDFDKDKTLTDLSREARERYEIKGKLGGGGMGVVLKAYDRKLQRPVALKVLSDELNDDETAVKRFEQEAILAAKLNHPNIVTIFDMEKGSGKKYISMAYIDGRTLESVLSEREKLPDGRREPLSEEEGIKIGKQVVSALICAHENGVIHRDIKPSNIMVDGTRRVIVTDFGIARAASRTTKFTTTGGTMGTPHYMSPEQAEGKEIDNRSDIYSFGIVFYEMLTGKVPFDAETPIALGIKHIREEPAPPRKINTQLSNSVEDVILKCLKKNPDERFQNGEELREMLNELIGDAEIKVKGSKSEFACPTCEFLNQPEDTKCVVCSTDLSHLFEKCPKCGKTNRKDQTRCAKCGINLIEVRRAKEKALEKQKIKDEALKQENHERYMQEGKEYEKTGEWQKAIDSYNEALKYIPSTEAKELITYCQEKFNSTPSEFTNSIGMKFVLIKAGTFLMGSPDAEQGIYKDETQHKVTITKDFYMQTTEITQAQYEEIIGKNPSYFKGTDLPVEKVSWDDAVEFCKKLSQKKGKEYRLPTEAEWEYACRAGDTGAWSGTGIPLEDKAWYGANSGGKTHPIGLKKSNAWGIYDMMGNVWEWCSDWYEKYPKGDVTDPVGPSSGEHKVLRGGSWLDISEVLRCALRIKYEPGNRFYRYGFRCAMTP